MCPRSVRKVAEPGQSLAPGGGQGLALEGLSVRYGSAVVIRRLDLDVRPGEIVGLVGPNGCGKTTTLRAISGLVPHGGVVTLDGKELPRRPAGAAGRGVAHVPEGRCLFANLTVRENIEVGAQAVRRRLDAAELDVILNYFPALQPLLQRRAGLLSGGEQQMAAIARGLASSPRVMLIDELSLGLAPKIVKDLLKALREIATGNNLALLLVDQNVEALRSIANSLHTIRVGEGVQVKEQDIDALKADYV